ncbi:hypothetical protein Trydic_g6800 [Trypoxylus dichotomus]
MFVEREWHQIQERRTGTVPEPGKCRHFTGAGKMAEKRRSVQDRRFRHDQKRPRRIPMGGVAILVDIFIAKGIGIKGVRVVHAMDSDHFPVLAELGEGRTSSTAPPKKTNWMKYAWLSSKLIYEDRDLREEEIETAAQKKREASWLQNIQQANEDSGKFWKLLKRLGKQQELNGAFGSCVCGLR